MGHSGRGPLPHPDRSSHLAEHATPNVRGCETVQEDPPDELEGKDAVKIVLPDGSTYTRCELQQ